MGSPKRACLWTVADVLDWVQLRHPAQFSTLRTAIVKHAISGRAFLRLTDNHLDTLGVAAKEREEILQGLLALRVQEELETLNEIYAECLSS